MLWNHFFAKQKLNGVLKALKQFLGSTSESIVSRGKINVGGTFSPSNAIETSSEHRLAFLWQRIFTFSVGKFSGTITEKVFESTKSWNPTSSKL